MRSRWTILAVLFLARAAMAFQFQSVAAASGELGRTFGASLADIGLLIGLYFAPGTALALPGSALGRRFGEKRAALAGLAMMLAGEVLMATAPSWNAQLGGRLATGVGGVVINVLMTKMLADWFAGREIATAMAIFVNSWPVGIAISLIVLPTVAAAFGLAATELAVAGAVAVALGLFAFAYRPPIARAAPVAHAAGRSRFEAGTVRAVVAAGLAWCLYNVGFAMIFSFGPSMLVARGWSAAAAGWNISIVLWLAAVSVPFGGWLADRTQRGGIVLVAGCFVFALLVLALSRGGLVLALLVAIGLVCGLPAGPIMSLPARVLDEETRPIGMGIFYTVYYAGMLVAPAIAGKLSAIAGNASAALDFGALALFACAGLFTAAARGELRDPAPPKALVTCPSSLPAPSGRGRRTAASRRSRAGS